MKKIFLIISCLSTGALLHAQNTPTGSAATQLALPAIPLPYQAGTQVSYVRTWESRKAVTDTGIASLNSNANFKTGSAYFDGLGRPVQTVVKGNNYDGTKDIVHMNVYDEFGREPKEYLPYAPASSSNGKFRLSAFSEQQAYYNTNYQEQYPFARNEYEASPGSQPHKIYGAGNSWAGSSRGVTRDIAFNTEADDIRTVSIGYTSGDAPAFGPVFPSGELLKSITTDEHGKQAVEYKDREERLILKKTQLSNTPSSSYDGWLCTYYVYDELGRLRYVIQSKGIEWLRVNGWDFTVTGGTQVKDELCFIYEYDADGRIIYKKIPGAAAVYMCYDKRDRLVFSQDGNLRSQNKWAVTFYDELNRPVSTALYSTTQNQNQLQTALDALTADNPVPVIIESALTRLTYNYYDEYTMPGQAAYNQVMVNTAQAAISAGDEEMENLAKTELVRGMITGTQIRVLGTSSLLKSTVYYDTKARALQSHSANKKGGIDAATVVYSFTGKVLSSYVQHNNPSALLPGTQITNVYTRNIYNNDYLLKTEKKINNEGWKRIAEMEYDDMGKPKKKMMGSPASNFYVNMDYNIRGWLTGINKTAQQNLENGSIGTSTFYDAIFSEVLHYDHGYTRQNYNGSISGIRWANASDKQARSYGYEYDNANRLMQADFTQKNSSTWNTNAGIDYSLMWMRYDANGNIMNLAQKALKLNSSSDIDRLKYDYLSNSNKLIRVTDTMNDAGTRLGDFKDGVNNGDDYAYDANGSMVLDNNKNISSIIYNHLNLPQAITITGKGTIEYTYDAGGNKLQKKVTEGTTVTTTDYVSGFVYHNDTLQFTGHEEGRMRYAKKYYYTGDSAYEWHYDYFYKDHLGNIRAVVTEQKDTAKYMATFEAGSRIKENALFSNINATAFPIASISPGTPGLSMPGNDWASRLNGSELKTGAAITLKVMAGDKVDLGVQYWYPENNAVETDDPIVPDDLFQMLLNGLSGGASQLSGGKAAYTELNGNGSPVYTAIENFLAIHEAPGSGRQPNAYLNWIFLDEQFKFVPDNSGFLRIGNYNSTWQELAKTGIKVPKSGYLFVYLSNETVDKNVFFDNLVVQHYTGPLSETTDYTAWGLDMKMIGSKAFGRLDNKHKYNGKEKQANEFGEGSGLDWLDYGARMYDNQLGRWMVIDPLSEAMEEWSPYNYTFCNPVNLTDPDGRAPEGEKVTVHEQATVRAVKTKKHQDADKLKARMSNLSYVGWEILVDSYIEQYGADREALEEYFRAFNFDHDVWKKVDYALDLIEARRKIREWEEGMEFIVKEIGTLAIPWSKAVKVFKYGRQIIKGGNAIKAVKVRKASLLGKKTAEKLSEAESAAMRGGNAAKAEAKSLGAGRSSAKQWLQNVGTLERGQLVKDIEKAGFKQMSPSNSPVQIFQRGGIKIRIDPPQGKTLYNHMHIEYGGNSYNFQLKIVDYKSPSAHIPIK